MTEINKMLSVMSLKVIIKVDTVITAAEREREREKDLPGERHVWGGGEDSWSRTMTRTTPTHMPSIYLASSPEPGQGPPPVKQNSTPGAAINLPSPRTRSILAWSPEVSLIQRNK